MIVARTNFRVRVEAGAKVRVRVGVRFRVRYQFAIPIAPAVVSQLASQLLPIIRHNDPTANF
jgi:hypothetical protein